MLNFLGFLLVLSLAVVLAEFPDNITKCQKGDNACYTQTVQDIVHSFPTGLRGLNLISVDPLHVSSMILGRNPSSPVNIELKFKNLDVIGLKTAKLTQIKSFDLNKRNVFETVVPELLLVGDYTADGQVLILPIRGKGKSVITCKNILLRYSFDLKPVEKNGEIYAIAKHVQLEFKPELVQFHFENLFNGDKALGDHMNKFLNENWRDIYNEMESGFATALSLVVKQVMNNVLNKFPFDSLFHKLE